MTEPAPAAARWWSWSRVRELDHRIVDPTLALVLLVICLAGLAGAQVDDAHPTEVDALAYVLTVITFGALAVRSRYPVPVLAVCTTATVAASVIEYPENGLPIACMIALYTVAALTDRRTSAVAGLVVAAVIVALTVVEAQGLTPSQAVGNLAMFGAAFAIGSYARVRRAYLAELELRAEATEENRRRAAEQAVAAERLRIARELHDVVAHAMSVVAVQSGVAGHVIDRDPVEAKAMLTNISSVSRQALTEMRRLLGVLRSEQDGPEADLTPAPSLDDLPNLVASFEGTGVRVGLHLQDRPDEVRPGVELVCYRVVQEALTNVVRHAGPASVEVSVSFDDEAVRLEVVDDGRGAASLSGTVEPPDRAGGGHGLIGMHERVDLYGGSLTAGPRPGGGFAVSAVLPYARTPVRS